MNIVFCVVFVKFLINVKFLELFGIINGWFLYVLGMKYVVIYGI